MKGKYLSNFHNVWSMNLGVTSLLGRRHLSVIKLVADETKMTLSVVSRNFHSTSSNRKRISIHASVRSFYSV